MWMSDKKLQRMHEEAEAKSAKVFARIEASAERGESVEYFHIKEARIEMSDLGFRLSMAEASISALRIITHVAAAVAMCALVIALNGGG